MFSAGFSVSPLQVSACSDLKPRAASGSGQMRSATWPDRSIHEQQQTDRPRTGKALSRSSTTTVPLGTSSQCRLQIMRCVQKSAAVSRCFHLRTVPRLMPCCRAGFRSESWDCWISLRIAGVVRALLFRVMFMRPPAACRVDKGCSQPFPRTE